MSKTLVLKPRVSEKAYGLSKERRTYVFDVPKDANKLTVAQAVTAQFNVTVEAVNIAVIKGKAKRTVRKGGRPVAGRQNDTKKAYVVLKEGDSLPVYAAQEEDAKPAKEKK
jgi:large subunit ribosomal protein L23